MKRIAHFLPILSSLLLLTSLCSCGLTESPPAAPQRGRLSIEAQIIYTSGGPQPVARDTFYLLDADLLDVEVPTPTRGESLEQALMRLTPAQQLKVTLTTAQAMEKLRGLAREQGRELPERPVKGGNIMTVWMGLELLKKDKATAHHFIQAAATDFQGRATFENIEPGDYWIMGATQTRSDFAFWNHKVSIRPGENKVLLDQNNALYSR